MKTIDQTKPVLVTGGSGYIASWLVKLLLEQGFTVHTTVRDKSRTDKIQHLLDISANTTGELKLFEADLLKNDSFAAAMQDCSIVFHTASPFFVNGVKDAKKELIDPALDGTRNVLQTVNDTPTVQRVVLTSSVAAIYGDNVDSELVNGRFTEQHWNTTSSLSHSPYSYSKTVAEKEAWRICEAQNRWDLLAINPGFVLGPSLTKRKDSTSIEMMLNFANGEFKTGVPELWMGIVDVRDVAQAHVLAGLKPEASGRHILVSESYNILDMAQILKQKHGNQYAFPPRQIPKPLIWLIAPFVGFTREYVAKNIGIKIEFDNQYSQQDLGLSYRSVEETVLDHFAQLQQDGLLN